jgi:peptidoglycan/xylan/chitin deacetylase (PgdA/CDA1 family)
MLLRALAVVCVLAGAADARVHHKRAAAPADPDVPSTAKKKHPRSWPSPAQGPSVSGDPEIIFTFDDGPNPRTTPSVLDTLAKHHIHAVFFQVGEMAGRDNKAVPAIEARILREGHIIGNHTMTHQDLCRVSADKAAAEIDDGKATIERVTGLTLAWFRTPYGVRCARLEDMLAARGLAHFHWDLDPQEWKHGSAPKAVAYVTRELGKMTGRNVLLMHDIKEATVKALPEILDWLDAENIKRAAAGKRQIRVIQSYQLAEEKLPAGLVDWLGSVGAPWASLPAAVDAVLP